MSTPPSQPGEEPSSSDTQDPILQLVIFAYGVRAAELKAYFAPRAERKLPRLEWKETVNRLAILAFRQSIQAGMDYTLGRDTVYALAGACSRLLDYGFKHSRKDWPAAEARDEEAIFDEQDPEWNERMQALELAANELLLVREAIGAKAGNGGAPAGPQGPPADTPAVQPPTLALMRVFTNGIADVRVEEAARLLADNELTANETLTKIDALIPFPATASAEQLGEMLGVTKQAVLKTDWWIQNRKGEKGSEVGRRRKVHRERAKSYEGPGQDDDE